MVAHCSADRVCISALVRVEKAQRGTRETASSSTDSCSTCVPPLGTNTKALLSQRVCRSLRSSNLLLISSTPCRTPCTAYRRIPLLIDHISGTTAQSSQKDVKSTKLCVGQLEKKNDDGRICHLCESKGARAQCTLLHKETWYYRSRPVTWLGRSDWHLSFSKALSAFLNSFIVTVLWIFD